jgi:hypothetical protein
MLKPIKEGDKFICKEDVYMKDDTTGHEDHSPVYRKGLTYTCEIDGCITNDLKDKKHRWQLSNGEVCEEFEKFFNRVGDDAFTKNTTYWIIRGEDGRYLDVFLKYTKDIWKAKKFYTEKLCRAAAEKYGKAIEVQLETNILLTELV